MTMQHDSILYEPISPLHASVDPRFSRLIRAANHREPANQQQVSLSNWPHSSSVFTVNSNAWSPAETTEKSINTKKKSCLSSAWKNRLQGLLVGLIIAAVSIAITLGVLLTKLSANSTTSTTTTASACSSLQWDENGVIVAGGGFYGSGSNQFEYPQGLYVDSNNTIYVADSGNHRIQQWFPNAVSGNTVIGVTGVSGSNGSLLDYPTAVYGDTQQRLYVGDNNGIRVWSLGASIGYPLPGSSGIGSIYGIFVDQNGNIYASISLNCAVRMWTPTATSSTLVAGGTGCGLLSSQLYYPYGLFVDSSTSTIFISNSDAETIVSWPIGATTSTIIAGQTSISGTDDFLLNNPYDVKCDPYGNLYVADTNNNRILLFCQNPPSTSGRIIAGYQLSYPSGIALDSNLNLYVLSQSNDQVQKFTRIV